MHICENLSFDPPGNLYYYNKFNLLHLYILYPFPRDIKLLQMITSYHLLISADIRFVRAWLKLLVLLLSS